MFLLSNDLVFPPVEMADEDGLLAIGGDLSTGRLLLAYQQGIFPWYSEQDPICWWCPDPRFVLFPDELKISRSMKRVLRSEPFGFTTNTAFAEVIRNCRTISRKDQDGTWISAEVQNAYIRLHELGYAHSAEAWNNNELVGGVYGVRLGNIFFGESMFSRQTNASKFALARYVEQLKQEGVVLIDCQVYTPHLESLGARMIPRKDFMRLLTENTRP
ncbi:MAG: leucyl/phenylalanyl-tRNA--protein transferase [Ferruginibacter sp.]